MKKYKKLKQKSKERIISETGLEKRKIALALRDLKSDSTRSPEAIEKGRKKQTGRVHSPKTLFKKGNQFGKLRKNRKISEEQKLNQSIKMRGRKLHSEEDKKRLSENFKKNNPMWNEEFKKKQLNLMSNKRKILFREKVLKQDNPNSLKNLDKRRPPFKKGLIPWNKGKKVYHDKDSEFYKYTQKKRSKASKNHPKAKENWFTRSILITEEIEKDMCGMYQRGVSMARISKKYGVDRIKTVRKILVKNNIPIKKDNSYYLLGYNFHLNKRRKE